MLSFARALPRTVALTRPAAAIGQTALRSATCSVRCFERAAPQPSTAPLAKFAALQVAFLWIHYEASSGADRCVLAMCRCSSRKSAMGGAGGSFHPSDHMLSASNGRCRDARERSL